MKIEKETLKLLGLSTKETKILAAIYGDQDTPVKIAQKTKISRPTIYDTIKRLHGRGLIRSTIRSGKKYWVPAKNTELDERLFDVKKSLFKFEEGVQEVHSQADSTVIVHRGREAVRAIVFSIMKDNHDRRIQMIQGDQVSPGWDKVVGAEAINELNALLKKNRLISEWVAPFGFLERQVSLQGKEWAEGLEGRMAVGHEIDEQYFDHGGQIWIFKDSLYLIAMNEEVIIEVRNSEIQKLVLEMFRFVQDNGRKFDVNARLRELIAKEEGK